MRTSTTKIFRALQKKALSLAGVAAHAPDFLPFFLAPRDSTLGRQLRARPELWGMAVTPFVCADWTVPQRISTLVEHCRRVDQLPAMLSQAVETEVELMRLEELGPSCRLVLHQVGWMLREGPLTLSLFDGSQRLFSLSFSLVGEDEGLVGYVGGLQGLHSPAALEHYREITKAAYGLRPRDLLFELFCALCRQLGVALIKAVSDERHSLTSDYARRNSPVSAEAPRLRYNDAWLERGGFQISTAFFELPVAARRRASAEIPAKKRKLYASRYLLLNLWESRLDAVMKSLPDFAPQAAPAAPRHAEPAFADAWAQPNDAIPTWLPTQPAASVEAEILEPA
ncbi:DUF535 family protein [Phenylobacterium sp. LjRoot225]|uniref:DUF535 family protein n=1 Tax=Phenylobacterium sp. LjRoot225 TaxID=3342285 RepID=UPI003ED10ED0